MHHIGAYCSWWWWWRWWWWWKNAAKIFFKEFSSKSLQILLRNLYTSSLVQLTGIYEVKTAHIIQIYVFSGMVRTRQRRGGKLCMHLKCQDFQHTVCQKWWILITLQKKLCEWHFLRHGTNWRSTLVSLLRVTWQNKSSGANSARIQPKQKHPDSSNFCHGQITYII